MANFGELSTSPFALNADRERSAEAGTAVPGTKIPGSSTLKPPSFAYASARMRLLGNSTPNASGIMTTTPFGVTPDGGSAM